MSDADLTAIITHGGPALNKSALMPAWGNTLSKSDIQALISYIRIVADPPSGGVSRVYAIDKKSKTVMTRDGTVILVRGIEEQGN